jgi:response regulator RpfG family c-di-GMP phosphodiesterase/DNA-binding SARP family transcriptional activator
MLEALSILLEEEGYNVLTATSGMEAVERAREKTFDLIVSDVRMAGMDGIQTLTSLREFNPTTRAIMITGYASPDIPVRAIKLGVDDYLIKPFDDREFLKSVRRSMENARMQKDFDRTLRQQWRDFSSIVKLLATGLEARDPYFEGHSKRVANLAFRIARSMSLGHERIEVLDLAAHLHDIGNIGTKLDIFNKTEKLLTEEMDEIRGSTRRAEEYLKGLNSLRDVFRIIVHHHEWFNGEGVPHRLKGDQIPIESRILAVAEAYDAMISPRPHRESLSHQEAVAIMQKEKGTHFDPQVVEVLIKLLKEKEEAAVSVDDDEVREDALSQKAKVGLLLSLGHTYLQNGNLEIAEKAYKDCLDLLRGTRLPVRAEALNGQALIHLQRGEVDQARTVAKEALEAAQGMHELLAGKSMTTQGLVEAQVGAADKATKKFAEARKVFETWEAHADIGRVMLLESLATTGGTQMHIPNGSAEKVKDKFLKAVDYLHAHDLTDVPAREKSLFAPLFVKAFTEGWQKEKLEPFLINFGQAALAQYLTSLEPAQRSEVQTVLAKAANNEKADAGPPPLSIYAFGKFRVFCGGREVGDENWKTRKSKYLFAYLACQGDRDAPDEKLMELFWPDHDPDKARQNLYSALSHIRKALEGYLPEYDKVVVSHKGFYRINSTVSHTVDVREFDKYYEAGSQAVRAGHVDEAIGSFQRAEALYQGEFLEGYYSDWALNYRDDFERKYQDILNRLMTYFSQKQRMPVVQDYCQKLLTIDPCDQEAHLNLMKCFVSMGKPEQAVRQYQTCCQVLKNELNLSPSPEIASLYLTIKG